MTLSEAISSRRSVRQYADAPVDRADIEKLLAAAVLAPSAMNSQAWAFGVIQGKERIQEIGERAAAAMLRELERKGVTGPMRDRLSQPGFSPFYGASAVVVIYATKDDAFSAINCSLAAQNLMLTAADMGLGTCWIGMAAELFGCPEVKADLGVPAEYRAIATIIVGHPAGESAPKEKNPPTVLFWQ
jgi:nitroreductase